MPGFIIFVLSLLLVAGFIVVSSLYVVKQQSVAIIERFGRYQKLAIVAFISSAFWHR